MSGDEYWKKDTFAIVTGTIPMPEADAGLSAYKEISYPSGFTKDNSVIVSLMSHNDMHTDYWSTTAGTNADAMSMTLGNAIVATLNASNIRVLGKKPDQSAPRHDITFRIVLMKLPS